MSISAEEEVAIKVTVADLIMGDDKKAIHYQEIQCAVTAELICSLLACSEQNLSKEEFLKVCIEGARAVCGDIVRAIQAIYESRWQISQTLKADKGTLQ